MDDSHLDLRLAHVLTALMRHRSVSKAADSLGMPQPTVSRALAKLRGHFNDPLFVRTRGGMEPTPVAITASDGFAEMLRIYKATLAMAGRFDPTTSTRQFTIAASDFGHLLVLPPLHAATIECAPGLRFKAIPLGSRPLIIELETGEVDLAVGGFPNLYAGVMEQTLFHEIYVCLVHPNRAAGDPMTLQEFQQAFHIVVSAQQFGHVHQLVEKKLLEIVPANRVRIVGSSFIVSALIAERSDLILTVPAGISTVLQRGTVLVRREPPLELPGFDVKLYWHERFHQDPANQWLRQTVAGLLREPRARRT